MDGLTVGRVVHYVLSEGDAQEINKLHEAANIPRDERVPGIQYHTGNHVDAGDHCAMVVVKVWNPDIGLINGKVLLDGMDDYWAMSRSFSDEKKPSSWHWIEKA